MKSTAKHRATSTRNLRTTRAAGASALSCAAILGVLSLSIAPSAFAAEAKLELGSASTYSVLGGESVTNTGESFLQGNLGVAPGTSITGFREGQVLGETHVNDAEANLAQDDLTAAYLEAASRTPTEVVSGDLVGRTLVSGVYKSDSTLDLTGTVTLDGQGDPSSVWIFQVGSALTTGSASNVELVNGANACNVYWQVGSSATIGTGSDFKGSILALTSISVTTDSVVEGRALAQNGSVTLDSNVFMNPTCAGEEPTVTPDPTTPDPAPEDPAPVEPAPEDPAPVDPAPTTPVEPEPTTPEPTTPDPTTPVEPAPTTPPAEDPVETVPPGDAPAETPPPFREDKTVPVEPTEPTAPVGSGTGLGNEEVPPPFNVDDTTPIGSGLTEEEMIAETTANELPTNARLADTGASATSWLTAATLLLAAGGAALLGLSSRANRVKAQH